MPHHTIPYRTIPCHAMLSTSGPVRRTSTRDTPCSTVPYYIIPYHTIPCNAYHFRSFTADEDTCHTMPYHTILHRTIPYLAMPTTSGPLRRTRTRAYHFRSFTADEDTCCSGWLMGTAVAHPGLRTHCLASITVKY